MSNLTLSIVIVSFNTREMTLECLRSVFRETRQPAYELIVLDNASADGSAKAIASEFGKRVRLIVSGRNLGFAAGNNLAVREAKGQYLLLLNPDTVVLDGAIDRLLEFAHTTPAAGIWGGRTLRGDGKLDPSSCWSRQTVWSLFCRLLGLSALFKRSYTFNPEEIGGWNREGMRKVDIVTGCFLLIKRDLWQSLNGFREIYFMYGEEADLCLRARLMGAVPLVTSAATIIHYGGASENIRADKLVRLLTAKMLLIREHFPAYSAWLGYVLLALWPLSRFIVHGVLSIFGRASSSESCAAWGEVVRRWKMWLVLSRS